MTSPTTPEGVSLNVEALGELYAALHSTSRELLFCAAQLAAHGQPGAKGDSVDRALAAADAALSSAQRGRL